MLLILPNSAKGRGKREGGYHGDSVNNVAGCVENTIWINKHIITNYRQK